jgi:hypothetical protein
MQMQKSKLIDRIKALLAKTIENGCTMAEAMTAFEKAQAMMREHGVSEMDVAPETEEIIQERERIRNANHIARSLAASIARFCGVRVYRDQVNTSSSDIVFTGFEGDVLLAKWMLDTLTKFVIRERDAFIAGDADLICIKRSNPKRYRLSVNGFEIGAVNRISCRLFDLAPIANVPEAPTDGKALVATKGAMIDAYLANNGVRLTSARKGGRRGYSSTADAGRAAGDRASFSRPVGGAAGVSGLLGR